MSYNRWLSLSLYEKSIGLWILYIKEKLSPILLVVWNPAEIVKSVNVQDCGFLAWGWKKKKGK